MTDPIAIKAVAATREDFTRRLRAEKKSEWEHATYLSEISNYNVNVKLLEKQLYIEYLPKQPKDGSVIKGGGGRYEVDTRSGAIIEFEGYE